LRCFLRSDGKLVGVVPLLEFAKSVTCQSGPDCVPTATRFPAALLEAEPKLHSANGEVPLVRAGRLRF